MAKQNVKGMAAKAQGAAGRNTNKERRLWHLLSFSFIHYLKSI
ncbi:hypothetical protein QY96_01149 [Bacillus thermotolerans]|nr:hypothetical protein QY96_01149 [Bacillus thermotolerans]